MFPSLCGDHTLTLGRVQPGCMRVDLTQFRAHGRPEVDVLPTRHKTATIKGQEVFYREAGPSDAPVVLLLHGFPSSSHMFRHLVPALADDYHVIATDHIGYGHSAMPKVDAFDYTFDNLAGITAGLLEHLGIERFAVYVHDYGAPIGWRLALDPVLRRHRDHLAERQRLHGRLRQAFLGRPVRVRHQPRPRHGTGRAGQVQSQYDPLAVRERRHRHQPGQPRHLRPSIALLERPGNDEIQLALFRDYPTNIDRTRNCTSTSYQPSAPARGLGRTGMRSSGRTARRRSPVTCRRRKSTCCPPGTSPWRRIWTPSADTSTDSSDASSHEAQRDPRPLSGCGG